MSYHPTFISTKSLGVSFVSALGRCLSDTTKSARRAEIRSFGNVLRGLHIIDSRPIVYIADAVDNTGNSGLLVIQAGAPEVNTILDSSGDPLDGN